MRKLFLLPAVFIIAAFNCNPVGPVSPSQPARVGCGDIRAFCVSGPYLFAGTYDGGIFRSTNNGDSWTAVNSGLTTDLGRPGPCVGSFAVSGNSIFAGTGYDQGLFLSTDNGESWTAVNSSLPLDFPVLGGCGPLIVHRDSIFAGTGSAGIFLSANNGKSWTNVSSGLTSWTTDESTGHKIKYGVTSFAECGGDLFAGTFDGVFRLTQNDDDGTIKWTAVSSGLESSGKYVIGLAVSGSNMFAGTDIGVFLSTDHGASWKLVSSGITDIPQPYAYNPIITSVFVSGNRLFASRQWGVFLSTDNGASWTAVKSGLSGQCVWTFFQSGNTIFAGTQACGVFRSTDNGDSWIAVNSGLH